MSGPVLTREQSRQVDQIAIDDYGIPGMVLMENAGRGVVDVLLPSPPPQSAGEGPSIAHSNTQVVILCGKGNNAGDGFVIARHLEIRGVRVKVVLLAPASELHGDAATNYQILTHSEVPIIDLSASDDLPAALNSRAAGADWLIDAMLGTGAQGEPREPMRTAIEWMNNQPSKRLAVDVPSGLDCDTGEPSPVTVRADITCTFAATKVGFTKPAAKEYLGELHVVSIGTPPRLLQMLGK